MERCLGILEPHPGKCEGLGFGIVLVGDRDTGDQRRGSFLWGAKVEGGVN